MKMRTCDRCGDVCIWVTPNGTVERCPIIQLGLPHPEPNDACRMLAHAVERLRPTAASPGIDSHLFYLACDIAVSGTSESPATRNRLVDTHFRFRTSGPHNLRHFHNCIERLRNTWLLPVASRKSDPAGYWIATDIGDFKAWVDRAKASPITQLSTIHRVAKANFPVFAEQLELEFFADIDMAA